MGTQHVSLSFRRGASLFCKRWTPQIVYLLLERPHRFSELLNRLDQVSDRMLSERLKELEASGVILRRVLANAPIGVEYSLTEAGQALRPTIVALDKWGDAHLPNVTATEKAKPKVRGKSA